MDDFFLELDLQAESQWVVENKEVVSGKVFVSVRNKNTEEEYKGQLVSITSLGISKYHITEKTAEARTKRPRI